MAMKGTSICRRK